MTMNLQITLITPTPIHLSRQSDTNQMDLESSTKEEDMTEFDQRGIWDEIFFLGTQVPSGALKLNALQNTTAEATWAVMDLVHIHATRDHLVLIDPSIVNMLPEEVIALQSSVQEVLDHYLDCPIIPIPPIGASWLIGTEAFTSLKTSSVELAKGRNIDIWMPQDTDQKGIARKWRQMQNEIQMIWHDHPVNVARLARGELPINSVWLHGVGSLGQIQPHKSIRSAQHVHGDSVMLAELARFLGQSYTPLNPETIRQIQTGHHLIHARLPTTPDSWEMIWQSVITLLHEAKVSELHLITEHQGMTYTSLITAQNFKSNIFKKLFFKKAYAKHRSPQWVNFASNITWEAA